MNLVNRETKKTSTKMGGKISKGFSGSRVPGKRPHVKIPEKTDDSRQQCLQCGHSSPSSIYLTPDMSPPQSPDLSTYSLGTNGSAPWGSQDTALTREPSIASDISDCDSVLPHLECSDSYDSNRTMKLRSNITLSRGPRRFRPMPLFENKEVSRSIPSLDHHLHKRHAIYYNDPEKASNYEDIKSEPSSSYYNSDQNHSPPLILRKETAKLVHFPNCLVEETDSGINSAIVSPRGSVYNNTEINHECDRPVLREIDFQSSQLHPYTNLNLVSDEEAETSEEELLDGYYFTSAGYKEKYVSGESEDTNVTGNECSMRSQITKEVKPVLVEVTPISDVPYCNGDSNTERHVNDQLDSAVELSSEMQGTSAIELHFNVDSTGGNFSNDEIALCGSIPENAIAPGHVMQMVFIKEHCSIYPTDDNHRFVSNVYHFLPHGVTFNAQILLRFPYFRETSQNEDNYQVVYHVVYSDTPKGEQPKWIKVPNQGFPGIYIIMTDKEVCLFLKRFCMFAVVAEHVPTKYINVILYAKFYPGEDKVKITIIPQGQDGSQNPPIDSSNFGKLIDSHSFVLVKNVEDVLVKITNINPGWKRYRCPEQKVLKTHFIWNGQSCKANFTIEKDAAHQSTFLTADITVAHDDDSVTLSIADDVVEFTLPRVSLEQQGNISSGRESDLQVNTATGTTGTHSLSTPIHNSPSLDNMRSMIPNALIPQFVGHQQFRSIPDQMMGFPLVMSQLPTPSAGGSIICTSGKTKAGDLIKTTAEPSIQKVETCENIDESHQQRRMCNLVPAPHTSIKKVRTWPGRLNLIQVDGFAESPLNEQKNQELSTDLKACNDAGQVSTLSACSGYVVPFNKPQDVRPKIAVRPLDNSQVAKHPQVMGNIELENLTGHQTTPNQVGQQIFNVVNIQYHGDHPHIPFQIKGEIRQPKIDHETKMELQQMLDTERPDGHDWRALADKLGFGLHVDKLSANKTEELLKIWESTTVTIDKNNAVEKLANMLDGIHRPDAAKHLRDMLRKNKENTQPEN